MTTSSAEPRFALGQQVRVRVSTEVGEVVGQARYRFSENSYLVRYCAADGRAVEQWWAESALVEADTAE